MKKTFKSLISALLPLITFAAASNDAQAQTYCLPNTTNFGNTAEWITNVTLGGINNSTGAGATSYCNFTSISPAQLTIGTVDTLRVRISPNSNGGDDIYAFIDWNQDGNLEPAERYDIAFGATTAGSYIVPVTPPALALTGTTRMRILLDSVGLNNGDPCVSLSSAFGSGGGEIEDYTVNVLSSNTTPVNSITVTTQGGAVAAITTNGGTLQMDATVLPAAAPQTVIWSIVSGTGAATISASGLVSAQTNGTVWAKAVSNVNTNKKDSLLITISNQQPVPVTSVTVSVLNGAPNVISTYGGTLQMWAEVLPANALQSVTWSIVSIIGQNVATISSTGQVTAQSNGVVWAKAVSTADPTKMDSSQVVIMNQVPDVDSVKVTTQGGVPATITTNAGTLQMNATIFPAAAPQTVTWSIVPGTGSATISATGLVTAQTNGTVWAKAVSTTNASKHDSLRVTITKQGTSIDDLFASGAVNVYPNPVSKQLNIDFAQWSSDEFNVSIVNLLGQEVYQTKIDNKKTVHNIVHLSSGTYILSIDDAKGNRSGMKINKQ